MASEFKLKTDFRFVSFGETMIRIAPMTEADYFSTIKRPSAATNTLTTVGGDEFNVAVALSKLDIPSEWISVLPTGPLGKIVTDCATLANVNIENMSYTPNSDVGVFFVYPEEKRVHYQRQHSAWAQQKLDTLNWETLFRKYSNNNKATSSWLHVTGITPMTGDVPAKSWRQAIEVAHKFEIPISMDFNHRKQLGPLEKLWDMTKPILKKLDLLILSMDSLKGLASLEKINTNQKPQDILLSLHKQWDGLKIVFCDKYRQNKMVDGKEQEVQTRFSVLAHQMKLFTTEGIPVLHIPKDECGGGSAWAAGYISSRMEGLGNHPDTWQKVLRRADLLAALCQETVGDHSTATALELLSVERYFEGKIADITQMSTVPSIVAQSTTAGKKTSSLDDVVSALKSAKVVPILRAKNSELTIERCKELIEMGCQALEITLDTPNVQHIVTQVKEFIQSGKKQSFLGIGTVLDKTQLHPFIGIIDFAISPLNPTGFIGECHKHNILAIPGACSPQELWNAKLEGAKVIKLFPSQLWNPAALKEVLNVGPLSKLNIMATGGITPQKYKEWIEAGAHCVGMGSRLCGNDLKYLDTEPNFKKEHELWKTELRKDAQAMFYEIHQVKNHSRL